jgi:hypothetical protein
MAGSFSWSEVGGRCLSAQSPEGAGPAAAYLEPVRDEAIHRFQQEDPDVADEQESEE